MVKRYNSATLIAMMKIARGRPRKWHIPAPLKAELEEAHRTASGPRERERLHAGLLASEGVLTLRQIAQEVGRARSCVQRWLASLVCGGVPALLARKSPPGPASPLSAEQLEELETLLRASEGHNVRSLRYWLWKRFGVQLSLGALYHRLNKMGVWASMSTSPSERWPKGRRRHRY